MAFKITCYGNDALIESTDIYVTFIDENYTVPYGDTLEKTGFSYSVRFTANPSENCSFTRWVYRLGSTEGTVQYSTSNPFTYSGSQDIYIRAEGEIEEPTTTIAKWSWTSSNGSATDEETDNARIAIVEQGYTTDFSHKVWNDMVDKVKELTDATIGYWDTSYATYNNTKMNSSPYTLTAVKFNSLRNNLELVGYLHLKLGSRTNIPVVSTGDIVKGDYFRELGFYINACIAVL